MVDQELINQLIEQSDSVVPILFKPKQFNVLVKLKEGKRLNESEKRYLRGNIKRKLAALATLRVQKEDKSSDPSLGILHQLGSYYITGTEALKHNGFGWFYESKIIEVINTKIEGSISSGSRSLRFFRVKSISKSSFATDRKTGLKYASNKQILNDTLSTKNDYVRTLWQQMLNRYHKLFVDDVKLQKDNKAEEITFSAYGV